MYLVRLLLSTLLGISALGVNAKSCRFPAIYNSDTGAISAAIAEGPPPNGESFFGHPSGRFCDGRLVIDFIAEKLQLPYLSPYLDSLGTSFRHGANFATGGSSIRRKLMIHRFDYIVRDSRACGLGCNFEFKRLMETMRVLDGGICYRAKECKCLPSHISIIWPISEAFENFQLKTYGIKAQTPEKKKRPRGF